MQERTCSKCGVRKPETEEFFRKRGTKDRGGLRPDCRDCSAARDKAYYQANHEKVRAAQNADYPRRAVRQPLYKRAYYRTERGREVIRRANRRWSQSAEGRARLAMLQQLRRARMAGLDAAFSTEDWQACLAWFGDLCAYCGSRAKLHQEHVVPVEDGGPYVPWNIVPACGSCNSSKSTKPLDEWFPRQTFFIEERVAMIADYFALVSP